jgi:hypothetical protein
MSDQPSMIQAAIRQQAHWSVSFTPSVPEEHRIPTLDECWARAEGTYVAFRGWDYPHVDRDNRIDGSDWIASWIDFGVHREYWRLYQSGTFAHMFGFPEDREHPGWHGDGLLDIPPSRAHTVTGMVDFVEMIWRLTEIFEFAARLAFRDVLGERVTIEIGLHKVAGRVLATLDSHGREWSGFFQCTEPSATYSWSGPAVLLAVDRRGPARQAARYFYERFGFRDMPEATLIAEQERLTGKAVAAG